MPFKPATRERTKARLAFIGMTKTGKSTLSLAVMRGLVGEEGRIAAIDTENGALSLYSGRHPGKKQPTGFDVQNITNFSPDSYIKAIEEAKAARYDGLIIDSITPEWAGAGGLLDIVDQCTDKFFSGWKVATPKHNAFIQTLIALPMHLIVTMRQKAEYAVEKDERGKNVPVKIGMQAIQREGMEYEFNLVGMLDLDHTLRVQYSCVDFLPNGTIVRDPDGLAIGRDLAGWFGHGSNDWAAPVYERSFYVGGKEYIATNGIERGTFVLVMNTGAALDRTAGKGAARELLAGRRIEHLTEVEGQELLATMQAKVDEANANKSAKSA